MFWQIFFILIVSAFSLPFPPVPFPSQESPVDPTTTDAYTTTPRGPDEIYTTTNLQFPTIHITSKYQTTTGGFTLPQVTSEIPTTTYAYTKTPQGPYESSTTVVSSPPAPSQPGIPTHFFSSPPVPGQSEIIIDFTPSSNCSGQPGVPMGPNPLLTVSGQAGISTSPGQPLPQGPCEIPKTPNPFISSPSERCLFFVKVSLVPNASDVARFLAAVLEYYQLETIPAQQRCRAVNHKDIIDITLKFTKDSCDPLDAQQLVDKLNNARKAINCDN